MNLSIEKLALEADVRPICLTSVFRRFYQETINAYTQKLRVDYVSELLLGKKFRSAKWLFWRDLPIRIILRAYLNGIPVRRPQHFAINRRQRSSDFLLEFLS